MNMDFALVNRALENVGQKILDVKIRGDETDGLWLTAKAYYLQTMLETLEQVEWAGAMRRRELAPMQMPYKGNAEFPHAYVLPIDCAKPVELDGREYFKTEERLLFTAAKPARLLYVSNFKRFYDKEKVISGGGAFRRCPPSEYVSGGDAFRDRRREAGDEVLSGGNASSKREATPPQPPGAFSHPSVRSAAPRVGDGEDWPDYDEPRLEPNFYYYWECLLSAKYAPRETGDTRLAMEWLAKAQAVGRTAQSVSQQRAAAKRKRPPTWQEQLGIHG